MKNKRLIGIIAALAVLVAGSLIYSSMNKPEAKNEKKVAKVGVLQFVSHPSLDLIYKGIQDGLSEEGYKDDPSGSDQRSKRDPVKYGYLAIGQASCYDDFTSNSRIFFF